MPRYADLTLIKNPESVETDRDTVRLKNNFLISPEPFEIINRRLGSFIGHANQAPNEKIYYDIYVPFGMDTMDFNELNNLLAGRVLPENLKCSLKFFNESAHRVKQQYSINPPVTANQPYYADPVYTLDPRPYSPPPPAYPGYPVTILAPTHDRLTQKFEKMTIEQCLESEQAFELFFNLFVEYLQNVTKKEAENLSDRGTRLVYEISVDNPELIKKLQEKLKTTRLQIPDNVNVYLINKRKKEVFISNKPSERNVADFNLDTLFTATSTASDIIEKVRSHLLKRIKAGFGFNKEEKYVLMISGNFIIPGTEKKFYDALQEFMKEVPTNIEVQLENSCVRKINLRDLLAHLQNLNKGTVLLVPLTLPEQITALQFGGNVPKELTDSLAQWKKSLAKSLEEAGEDETKREVLQSHVTKTQNVIRAYEQWDQTTPLPKELQQSIEAFTQEILTLSDLDRRLCIAAVVFSITITVAITVALCVASIGVGPLIIVILPIFLAMLVTGFYIAPEVIKDKFAIDAVTNPPINPNPSELTFGFSKKIKELGFFGNTPTHKARNFIDAVEKKVSSQLLSLPPVGDNPVLTLLPVYQGCHPERSEGPPSVERDPSLRSGLYTEYYPHYNHRNQ